MLHTHALATDNICEPTEEQLTDEGTARGSNLDTEILVGVELAAGTINITQHGGGQVDGEDIIAVEGIPRGRRKEGRMNEIRI